MLTVAVDPARHDRSVVLAWRHVAQIVLQIAATFGRPPSPFSNAIARIDMEYRTLGRSGLKVSTLTMGTM
ncbi:MAG: hypothetical protein E5W26_29630, partial [Mesorhizobium sp.]